MEAKTQQLVASLTQAAARWTAKDTPQSALPDDKRHQLLGATPPSELVAAVAAMAHAPMAAAAAPSFAPAVDWRNHNGNHVSPVKDQGGCGSCVSFGSCALIESKSSIENGHLLDLSEADSHF